jgi:TPR repeat protein
MKKLLLVVLLVGSLFAGDLEKGFEAVKRGDYQTALKLWKPLAEQGDPTAQRNLGAMYGNGNGVKQDYKEALKWYRLAAEQGFPNAQYNLGVLYYYGEGVSKDKIKSYQWWLKAAKQGYTNAQYNLDILCKESPWACQK